MKAVSIRLKAVVCELAMLPAIFSSAKDCARIPVTAVVRAPKIPMTSSPTAFGPSGGTRKESRNAARDGASAAPEDEGEIDQSLKRKGRLQRTALSCYFLPGPAEFAGQVTRAFF